MYVPSTIPTYLLKRYLGNNTSKKLKPYLTFVATKVQVGR